jgi:hypothetical protein
MLFVAQGTQAMWCRSSVLAYLFWGQYDFFYLFGVSTMGDMG